MTPETTTFEWTSLDSKESGRIAYNTKNDPLFRDALIRRYFDSIGTSFSHVALVETNDQA